MKPAILLLVMIFAAVSFAIADSHPAEVPYLHDVPKKHVPSQDPPLALRLLLGHFNGEKVSEQLTGESGGFTLGVGFYLYPRKRISYLLEISGVSREFDMPADTPPTPILTTRDNRADLSTNALLLGVRVATPDDQILRLHASGGIGYFKSELEIKEYFLGIVPTGQSVSDSSFGLHAGLGIDATVKKWVFGVEYRHWFVDGNFDAFGIGDVNLGGDLYTFSIGKLLY